MASFRWCAVSFSGRPNFMSSLACSNIRVLGQIPAKPHPNSEVAVKDLQSGELTPAIYKP
jgi:hypothetical protein